MERIPARIQKMVTPFDDKFAKRVAHGFEACSGTRFDNTGLVSVKIAPAMMARALEYLLSIFTNAIVGLAQIDKTLLPEGAPRVKGIVGRSSLNSNLTEADEATCHLGFSQSLILRVER